MSHDIHRDAAGRDAFVSLRKSAWHTLGTVVDDEMTDDQLLKAAGLDWRVESEPIFQKRLTLEGDTYEEVDGSRLLVRGDTGKRISVVSDQYVPFQNREMVELMRDITGDTDLIWETAGALGDRAQSVWCLARCPELDIALGDDITKSYMLISNGHGNKRALQVMPTAVRVVCANTLSWAEGGRAKASERNGNTAALEINGTGIRALRSGFAIRHSSSIHETAALVAESYQGLLLNHGFTKGAFEAMAAKPMPLGEARGWWGAFFESREKVLPADADQAQVDRRDNARAKRLGTLTKLWRSETCQTDAASGTVWGAYNALTEYVDHESASFSSAMFGNGKRSKDDALDEALALAR